MPFTTVTYLNDQGELSANYPLPVDDQQLLKAYQAMVATRHVDERMITLQRQGSISFAMSALGEEVCSVASAAALESGDWMYPQYREAGILFWRGFSIVNYIHHMFGNAHDLILGRQMPNHFGSREMNVVTVSSPIGTKIPHAAGCAYAMKVQKDPHVAICYFGEGAASEGDFHCGVNFAAVRKAPVIFFCRNNGYAISTPASKQYASDGIAAEGVGHGVTTFRVDGNDYFAVYEVTKRARQHCLDGKGPVLIEAMTYRLGAHSTSDDPSRYRKDEELEPWKSKDPILRLRRYLEKRGLWNDEKQNELETRIAEEVTKGIAIAKEAPKPPLESLIEHVYFEVPQKLKEEYQQLQGYLE